MKEMPAEPLATTSQKDLLIALMKAKERFWENRRSR